MTGVDASFANLAELIGRSTVQVYAENRGGGSGVVWRDDGAIVTNAHVVGSAADVWIESADGRKVRGEIVLRDDQLDLAEVSVRSADCGFRASAIGRADALRVGDIVAALGAPLGIAGALSVGIVHRAITDPDGRNSRWLEADLRLAPGNSGGPMVDAVGRVVGINSMIAGGLALAVPSEIVDRFVRTRGARAWLGVTTQPVALRGTAAANGLAQDSDAVGFMIVEFATASPAQLDGLALGDVIVGAGGKPFDGPSALWTSLEHVVPGDHIELQVLRDRRVRKVSVGTGKLTAQVEKAA